MRRPHVYERTAPRARSEATPQAARPAEVSRWISRSLPHMIDEARAAGLDRLADALEVARAEAETVVGQPGMVVER
ncbi:hypothetical protein D3273_13385 [Lichenibacterium minor]|uniref:Uncharacterized protein n=1 Tax=Lichenibacterium minor TaxID=2316528 RepID=A0A4Q2U8H8_9HYPH|nr:hypothetical protein [Lichenibacterium minor]RYC31377.1 hypothetical protein D3273_13385 [Lichenibacterium minor]